MRALIWKEVRELAPGFWLLLGSSWALGVVDVAYNWREDRAAGLSLGFCWLMSMVAALLAGANSFARESRQQTTFLGSWPTSRGRIWLAKVLVPAAMWALLVALAFGACAGLLAMRGHDPTGALAEMTAFLADEWWLTAAVWALLFGAGVLVSVALPSPMGAALVAVVTCVGAAWGYVWLYDVVPGWFGPHLGLVLPDIGEVSHLPPALVFLAVCTIVSAVVARRGVFRAWPRRALLGLGGLALALAVTLWLGLAGAWVALRPDPPTAASTVMVEGSGRFIIISSDSDSSIWAVGVEGGRLQPIARGPSLPLLSLIPRTPRVHLAWEGPGGEQSWVADLAGGGLWRLPEGGGSVSPAGSYCVTGGRSALTLHPIGPAPHDAVRLAVGEKTKQIVGWSPDEETVYVSVEVGASGVEDHEQRLLAVRPFDGGETRTIATLDPSVNFDSISPDGQWVDMYTRESWQSPDPPPEHTLVHLHSGETVPLGELRPWWRGWTTDGRYLWCSSPYREEWTEMYVAVFDLERREVARTITVAETRGVVPYHGSISPYSAQVLIFAGRRSVEGEPRREWWLANPDGSHLRPALIPPTARIAGRTHDGDVVVWEDGRIDRLDPDTGERRTIMELPLPADENGGG